MALDPGRIRNWAAIVGGIVATIIGVAAWVARSEDADINHETAIEANRAAIVEVRGSVDDIVGILERQADDAEHAAAIAKAKRDLMRRLCADADFEASHDLDCKLSRIDG